MSLQPQIIELIREKGLHHILNFKDQIILQFIELFMIQVDSLSLNECRQIFESLLLWSQSNEMQNIFSSLNCLNLLLQQQPEFLTPILSIQILPILQTENRSLGLELIQKSNWKNFTEENLIQTWEVICKQLLLFENEEICIEILQHIADYYRPFQLIEIIEYLYQANEYYAEKIFKLFSTIKLNRNYDQITSQLLDQMCIRIIYNSNLVTYLESFLENNNLLSIHNFPNKILQIMQFQD